MRTRTVMILAAAAMVLSVPNLPVHAGESVKESSTARFMNEAGKTRSSSEERAKKGKVAAGVVDVNRAGVAELTSIPGIGPALARRIVEYRESNGPFKKVEELLAVKGIGPRLLERIRAHVKTGAVKNDR